jgi:hypothetical protein
MYRFLSGLAKTEGRTFFWRNFWRIFIVQKKSKLIFKIKDFMKTKRILIIILLFVPILSFAGEIYGTIKGDDGKPLTNKVIQIKLNDKVMASDTTDTNGFFTVTIKEVGKFKLEVVGYTGAGFDVFSANSSTRYNLLMNKAGDKWILKSL